MTVTVTYSQIDKQAITSLLVGRRVMKIADDTLVLDDGRLLRFEGNDGGCCCSAGCYDLTDLNDVDNIITKVGFVDSPDGDDLDGEGHYKIFVFAGHRKINLATFKGNDGNGYYGTGYSIHVSMAIT